MNFFSRNYKNKKKLIKYINKNNSIISKIFNYFGFK